MNSVINVSVCIAVYGKSKFLEEQLFSVINQDYPIYEIVIVEDKHPNESSKYLINNFINDFSKIKNVIIKYISLDENVGPANAFRLSIINSTGAIIAFCDHDDIWNRDKISSLLPCFNSSVKAVYHNGIVLGSDEQFQEGDNLYNGGELSSKLKITLKNCIIGATILIDGPLCRIYADKCNLNPMHDWVLVVFLLMDGHKIDFYEKPLMFYRRHSQTVTGKSKSLINKILQSFYFRFQLFVSIIKYLRSS